MSLATAERRAAALYRAPAVAYLLLMFAAPLAMIAGYSVLDTAPDGSLTGALTLDNYRRALDPLYLGVLLRSATLALVTTALCILVAYPCALALRSFGPRARAFALAALIVPSWLNLLVRNYSWIVVLRRDGVLNTLLSSAGITREPVLFLFNDAAVAIGLVHTYLPFMILPLYAAVERMDWALVEAARDLGARGWQQFTAVILPQTRAGALVGCILVFIPALGAFVTPDLLGGARSMMVANLIENQVLQVRDWPFAAALSMFLVVLVLLAAAAVRRLTRNEAVLP